jgi:hypothetical protein
VDNYSYVYHYCARATQFDSEIGTLDGILRRTDPIKTYDDYQDAKRAIIAGYCERSGKKHISIIIDSLSLIWKD